MSTSQSLDARMGGAPSFPTSDNSLPLLPVPEAAHSVQKSPRRRQMTLRESLMLSPYQKWKKHGQLPTKLIVHLVVALVSAFLQTVQAQDTELVLLQTKRDLSMLLYPIGCVGQWRGVPEYRSAVTMCNIRTIDELRELFVKTVDTALNMEQLVVSSIQPFQPSHGAPVTVTMEAWFTAAANKGGPTQYKLSNDTAGDSLGPLSPNASTAYGESWRVWLDSVERMELRFDISDNMQLASFFYPALSEDAYWRIVLRIDPARSRTSMQLELRMHQLNLSSPTRVPVAKVTLFALLGLLNIVALSLAARSFFLALFRLVHLTDRFEYAERIHAITVSRSVSPSGIRGSPTPRMAGQLNAEAAGPSITEEDEPEPPRLTHHRPPAPTPPAPMMRASTQPIMTSQLHATHDDHAAASSAFSGAPSAHGVSSAHGALSAHGASLTHDATVGPRPRPSLTRRLSRSMFNTVPEKEGTTDAAAFLANLHVEYPFLHTNRVVEVMEGASGDVVADTMREARAWLKLPFVARFASLLSFFVVLEVCGNVCLLVYVTSIPNNGTLPSSPSRADAIPSPPSRADDTPLVPRVTGTPSIPSTAPLITPTRSSTRRHTRAGSRPSDRSAHGSASSVTSTTPAASPS